MSQNRKEKHPQIITAYKDLLVISVISAIVLILATYFDAFGILIQWYDRLEVYKLDEILTLLLVLAFAFGIFSLRRWRELKEEIASRSSQEAEIRLLAQTVVSVKDCVSIIDLNDNILFVNEAFIKTYGYSEEELLGKNISIVRSVATHAGEWHGEVLDRKKDGTDFPVELWTSIVKNRDGKPVAVVSIARNITERKRIEEALKQNEEWFRSLFENSTIGLYRTTPDGKILLANPALITMLGFSSFEELSKRDLLQEGYAPSYERSIFWQRLERDGKIIGLESSWEKKDGTFIFVRESAIAIRNANGVIIHCEGTVEDITDRKKAEETIAHERDLLYTLMDSIPDTIYFKDTAARFTRINQSQARFLGLSHPDQAIGKTDLDFQPPELSREFYKEELELLKSGQPIVDRIEYNPTVDGKPRWLSSSKAPIKDHNGKIVGLVGISRDITERKQREVEREKLLSELREALANIKTLSGLIPICASCRKIRDDKGYWNQLEAYVMKHTDAQFSHGMCPECTKKYFDDLEKGI